MDSRRLDQTSNTPLFRKIAEMEHGLYDQIPHPDLIVRLSVPIETALVRNRERQKDGKESDSELRQRYAQNSGLSYHAKSVHEIDTSGQLDTTMRDIKSVIWRQIVVGQSSSESDRLESTTNE